jgi:hypothetical protein
MESVDETRQEVGLRKMEERWQRTLRRKRTSSAWRIGYRFGLVFWGLWSVSAGVRTVLHIAPSFVVFIWNLFGTIAGLLLTRQMLGIIRHEPHPPGLRLRLTPAGPRFPRPVRDGHDAQPRPRTPDTGPKEGT